MQKNQLANPTGHLNVGLEHVINEKKQEPENVIISNKKQEPEHEKISNENKNNVNQEVRRGRFD